jgi:hypothetical protein
VDLNQRLRRYRIAIAVLVGVFMVNAVLMVGLAMAAAR